MKIVLISGSTQANSQSRKLADYLAVRLKTLKITTNMVDLHGLNLPLLGAQDKSWQPRWAKAEAQLKAADGCVFIIPEWNGGANPGLKNMLLYSGDALAHKPVMLVGVSAGRGGANPLMDARSAGHKDARYIITPESIIVSSCHDSFNDQDFSEDASDLYLKKRADYALKILVEYAAALTQVRTSKTIDHKTYPFGV